MKRSFNRILKYLGTIFNFIGALIRKPYNSVGNAIGLRIETPELSELLKETGENYKWAFSLLIFLSLMFFFFKVLL